MSHGRLLARHKNVMPSWLSLYYEEPIALVRGEGRRVWDAEGNEYLDFFGGILTTSSGHCVPEVVEAIKQQSEQIIHSSTLYLIEPALELAEMIRDVSPVPDAKVFFVSSGSEAVDTALLLTTTYRRSNQVIALSNSYHGRSFTAMAVTGNRGWSASGFSPLQVTFVRDGYRYRSSLPELSDDEFVRICAEDLRYSIETATSGDVACMIAEPIQGVGGFVVPPHGYFKALKEVLDQYGIPFISDEVQTGWGRTGTHFWGIEAYDVVPDVMVFAKGLGNGLAIGGVVARAEIMDCLEANSIATFGGNALCTAGALANLRYILENDLQSNALKVGEHLLSGLRELERDHEIVGEVRGMGLMLGVELVRPGGNGPGAEVAARVIEECKSQGLLVGKGGLYGNVIRIAPPLSVTIDEADSGVDMLRSAIRVTEKEILG